MQAIQVHEGGELRFESRPRPDARPRGGGRRAAHGGAESARSRSSATASTRFRCRSSPAPTVPVCARDTGEEVVHHPVARLGRSRSCARPRLPDPRRPSRRHLRRARVGARGQRLPRSPPGSPGRRRRRFRSPASPPTARSFPAVGCSAGETVLVLGAGSGVSTFAVQLAAQAGARVLVTSSSDEKIDRSRELGGGRRCQLRVRRLGRRGEGARRRRSRDRLGRLDVAAVARLPAARAAGWSSSVRPAVPR